MNLLHGLTLLSLALLVAGALAEEDKKATLGQLCELDRKAPAVTSISEVKSLIGELKDGKDCPEGVKDAIMALEPVVELKGVCSVEAADAIVAFWAQYIDKESKVKKNLPKQLKKFFISFGLQASKLCKQTMVQELEKVSEQQGITEQDLHMVTRSIKESEKVQKIFGSSPKIEDLMLVVQLNSAKGESKRKVNMPPKQKKYFEWYQERCVQKFKPVYDTLVLPIVRLATIGLNYKDDSTKAAMESFHQSPTFKEWFTVIVACEPVAHHEAVLIPAEKLDQFGNKAMVTILDDEDIAELKEKTGLTLEEPAIVAPVDYKVDAQLADLVFNQEDKHLTSSIQWYGKGLKETTKYRLKLIKRLPSLIRSLIKSGNVQFGLKPVKAEEAQKRFAKFGMSKQSKVRTSILLVGYTLTLGALAGAVALGVMFHPLILPIAVAGGIIVGLLFAFTNAAAKAVPWME